MKKKYLHIYDFLLSLGGAESVALGLCDRFEHMDLLVGFINYARYPKMSLPTCRIQSLTSTTLTKGWQVLKVGHCFKRATAYLQPYEKVIFSGSSAPLASHLRTSGGCVMYCHTPPRFIYDLKKHYLSNVPTWQRFLLKGLIYYFRPQYETAIDKMDLIIANSVNVQGRIKKYLGKESIVIHPPCDTARYKWLGLGDYYLSTARLEPYKRVDHIVKAFIDMPDKQLIVASGGSQFDYLKELAQGCSNIKFTGWCTEEQLSELVGNAIATLYIPLDEDFGMSPVESMAAGKPVIGINEGGVKETVVHKKTGILIKTENIEQRLVEAVNALDTQAAALLRRNCEERAKVFDSSIFFSKIERVLETPNNKLSQLINDPYFNL